MQEPQDEHSEFGRRPRLSEYQGFNLHLSCRDVENRGKMGILQLEPPVALNDCPDPHEKPESTELLRVKGAKTESPGRIS